MTSPHVELLWFEGCPNHEATEQLLRERLQAMDVRVQLRRIEVADEATGMRLRFPGSPTIRVDGIDVEPGWEWSGDGTPRCRLYATSQGLRGVPEAAWIDARLREAVGRAELRGDAR